MVLPHLLGKCSVVTTRGADVSGRLLFTLADCLIYIIVSTTFFFNLHFFMFLESDTSAGISRKINI